MQRVHTRLRQISGNVASLQAQGVKLGEIAVIDSPHGRSLAEVIRLDGNIAYLQVYAGCIGVSTHSEIRFLGHGVSIRFCADMLGRTFDGAGRASDGGPELLATAIGIGGPTVNPAKRTIPNRMIRTNIPIIDMFNTLVVSQKLPIFSIAGEPYNPLLGRIALQAEADVIVLGGMGLKNDDLLYFKHALERGGAIGRTVSVAHTASDPTAECLMVPDVTLTIAEQFALEGKDVLVLLSDMTNYADALKETAITMEQVPSNRGYPGDLYSQLARRYEKAVDFEGAGSITILAVTTMPGDDITHPVPDNTGYITEGQLYLHNGQIDPFGSLSRLKQLVNKDTRDDHRELMDAMIRLFASSCQTIEKRSMGFQMTDWDHRLLKYNALFEKQMMDINVNIPLESALDTGWEILASCFRQTDVGMRSTLIDAFWPNISNAPSLQHASEGQS